MEDRERIAINYPGIIKALRNWEPGDNNIFRIASPTTLAAASLVFSAGLERYPIREKLPRLNPQSAGIGSLIDEEAFLNIMVSAIYWNGQENAELYPFEQQREDAMRVVWAFGTFNDNKRVGSFREVIDAYNYPRSAYWLCARQRDGLRAYLRDRQISIPEELERLLVDRQEVMKYFSIVSKQQSRDMEWWSKPMDICVDKANRVDEAEVSKPRMTFVDRRNLLGKRFSSFPSEQYRDLVSGIRDRLNRLVEMDQSQAVSFTVGCIERVLELVQERSKPQSILLHLEALQLYENSLLTGKLDTERVQYLTEVFTNILPSAGGNTFLELAFRTAKVMEDRLNYGTGSNVDVAVARSVTNGLLFARRSASWMTGSPRIDLVEALQYFSLATIDAVYAAEGDYEGYAIWQLNKLVGYL